MGLTGQFLVWIQSNGDMRFAHSLTLICEHNERGATGVVVNRPSDIPLSDLLAKMDIRAVDRQTREMFVYDGGPVQRDRGFVLHRPVGNWYASTAVTENVALTLSRDVLEAAGRGEGPDDMLVSFGFACWGPGQLETELKRNAWLTVCADPNLLFDVSVEERLGTAVRQAGIDLTRLSLQVGHA